MYCSKCGFELREGAMFCPGCGVNLRPIQTENDHKRSSSLFSGKLKAILIALIIIIVVPIVVVHYAKETELAVVKTTAENYMDMIKNGPDNETMDEIVDQLIYRSINNEMIASYLAGKVNGDDINDIYSVVMKYMEYQVKDVQKIEPEHYQVTIAVSNLNNMTVGIETVKYFISRYTDGGAIGAIMQAIEDLSSDKSQTLASLMCEVADYMYSQNDQSNYVSAEYLIDINKVNGEWVPSSEQGLTNFAMSCAGIRTY